MDTRYCQDCGQELRSDAGFCDRCGTQQGHSPQEQQPEQDGTSTLKTILMVVGAIVLLFILVSFMVGFIQGLGGNADANQEPAEQSVEVFYQAYESGDEAGVVAALHSNGPAAQELSDGTGGLYLENANTEVEVLDSEVVDSGDGRILLDAEIEQNEFGSEPTTDTVRVELRTEDGKWKIWEFPNA